MTGQLVLAAGGSHLYPGAQGTLRGTPAAGPCLVEFADGSAAFGTLGTGAEPVLELGPYVTARGTAIPARRWTVALGPGRFRVLARP